MRPSATCELFLDGARVPDTAQALLEGTPTALDVLALSWGRDGANEQPGPATCSFRILDQTPNPDFLDELHVGSTVAVWAQGQIPGAGGTWGPSTLDDGSFTTKADGPVPLNDIDRMPGNTASHPQRPDTYYDAHTLLVEFTRDWGSNSYAHGVTVPPRAFSPNGELPNAWDDIPKVSLGETWRIVGQVKAPAGVVVYSKTSVYWSPYASETVTGTGNTDIGTKMVTGNGAWQTIDYTSKWTTLSRTGWVAITFHVISDPRIGRRWQDQTTTWAQQTTTWNAAVWDSRIWIDNLAAYPPLQTSRRVLVFSGSVTDMQYAPLGDGVLEASFTAADLGATLGNVVVGDTPWPVQTVATRADRIAQLAGITTNPRIRIDTPLGALQVSARDVDAQPSYELLQDLAQTAGGVLWAATHAVTGPYLYLENPANRTPLAELTLSGGVIVITGSSVNNTLISACDLLEDPVRWTQDAQDVATVAAVTWLEQGTDDEGQPMATERTATITDAAGLARFGTRRLSVSTELIGSTDATNLANRLLASARAIGWRISGLTLDTDAGPEDVESIGDDQREIALLNMLDGTTRMGLGVVLVDMPAYAPRGAVSSVYLEGGTYRFEGGAWTLELGAVPGSSQGTSVRWNQLDATWKWNQWAPAITWQSLFGVAP